MNDDGPPPTAERLAALGGAVSFVLSIVGQSLADHGGHNLNPGQTPEELAAGFARYADQARAGAVLMGAATALGLIFLGPLWSRLRRGSDWLAVVAVAGGITNAAVLTFTTAFVIAGTTVADFGDGQSARLLMAMEWDTARVAVAPTLATVGAATLAGFQYRLFGMGFCWFSLAFTVLLIGALLPIGPSGLLGMSGGVWVFVAAFVLAFPRLSRAAG